MKLLRDHDIKKKKKFKFIYGLVIYVTDSELREKKNIDRTLQSLLTTNSKQKYTRKQNRETNFCISNDYTTKEFNKTDSEEENPASTTEQKKNESIYRKIWNIKSQNKENVNKKY